jgi:cytochrome c556
MRKAMKRKLIGISAALALLSSLAAGMVFAHEGAEGVVKFRMDTMKGFGAQLKVLATMIRGKEAFDSGRAASAAQSISDHSDNLFQYFPKGSDQSPIRAAPAIWTEWDEFTALIGRLKIQADQLSEVAANATQPSELSDEFTEIGNRCKSCHSQFRLPE